VNTNPIDATIDDLVSRLYRASPRILSESIMNSF